MSPHLGSASSDFLQQGVMPGADPSSAQRGRAQTCGLGWAVPARHRSLSPRSGPTHCCLLSPATRTALPPRMCRGPPKKRRQKPPRRRSDLVHGPCPVPLGWGPSRSSASDRRRNNCAKASCCVCGSSRPGGASMLLHRRPPCLVTSYGGTRRVGGQTTGWFLNFVLCICFLSY